LVAAALFQNGALGGGARTVARSVRLCHARRLCPIILHHKLTAWVGEPARPLAGGTQELAYECKIACRIPRAHDLLSGATAARDVMSVEQFIQGIIGGLAIGCIYSLIALGITMIIRATEILHFAQGEIMMIGAMTGLSAVWMVGLPFVVVLAIGMIGGGVAAMVIELSVYRTLRSLRVPLINVVVSTLGVSLILQNVARLVWGSEPLRYPILFSKRGIDVDGFAVSPQLIWIVVLGFAMMALLQLFFRYTRLGIAMQAAAQDPEAAQLMGVNVKRTTTYTFLVSGIMAGAAGVLLGSLFFASFNMGFLVGIKAFVAATIGGLGSLTGAMLGGIIFGLIETFSGVLISTAYKDAVGMVLLILILLLAPSGIFIRAGRRI
jgi:branched-chain amino acid transport system permease protein